MAQPPPEWETDAQDQVRRFLFPLPGEHHPPNPEDVATDIEFINQVLSSGWTSEDRRVHYQEPLSADFMTAAVERRGGRLWVVWFDAWPKGTYPLYPDDPRDGR